MPKWLRLAIYFLVAVFLLVAGLIAFINIDVRIERAKGDARVRHYFALSPDTPLTEASIKSALLARFPINTPVDKAQAWLAAQGLGVDGQSSTWQEKQMIGYQVNDYVNGFIDNKHIGVSLSVDSRNRIQEIDAWAIDFSL